MEFMVKGSYKKGNQIKKFTKKISAKTKNSAKEKVFSILGSNYKCKRNLIKIESIEEIK